VDLRKWIEKRRHFPLADILASRVPMAYDPATSTTNVYHAAQIPEINLAALTIIAISMFWRGFVWATGSIMMLSDGQSQGNGSFSPGARQSAAGNPMS